LGKIFSVFSTFFSQVQVAQHTNCCAAMAVSFDDVQALWGDYLPLLSQDVTQRWTSLQDGFAWLVLMAPDLWMDVACTAGVCYNRQRSFVYRSAIYSLATCLMVGTHPPCTSSHHFIVIIPCLFFGGIFSLGVVFPCGRGDQPTADRGSAACAGLQ